MTFSRTHVLLGCVLMSVAAAVPVACSSSSGGSIPDTTDANVIDTGVVVDTGIDAPACVADLMTDSKNCGRCGHDCGGGAACSGGLCATTQLGLAASPVTALVAGSTRVYWEANGVFACQKGGCGGAPTTLLAQPSANGGIETTTLGDELVYFTIAGTPGHIGRCNPGGTCADDHVTVDLMSPSRIIATTTDLFFGTDYTAGDGGDAGIVDSGGGQGADAGEAGVIMPGGAVLRAALAGGNQLPSQVSTARNVLGFAFAGSTLMWTDRGAGITVCKLPCADPAAIAAAGTGVSAPPSGRPAIGAGVAFWPTAEGGIVRCSPQSCQSTRDQFLSPDPERVIGDLASDGQTLYFAIMSTTRGSAPSQPSGQIASCAVDAPTCVPEPLAKGLPSPNRISIDGASIFWANGSDSTDGTFKGSGASAVLRVAR